MSLEYAAQNPFRPADWRWQRATALFEGTPGAMAANRRLDGPDGFTWINTALRFLREYNTARTETARARLSERRPGLFWAYWIWRSTNPLKHVIEAQLLARSSAYSIGYRCNTAPDVINAYEAMFFNVNDKIQHRSYILNCVIGPAIHRGLTEREYDLLWKLYGYFLGPAIVDALEGKFANPTWCGTPTAVGAAVMDDAISTLKLKAAIATKTVKVDQYTQLAIMDAFTKFVEIERTTDSAGKAQEQILDHISAMMTTLPFNVGGRVARGLTLNSPVDAFEKTAIELNYEEVLRLSVRQPIAHQQILQRLTFPVTQSTQLLEGAQ